MPLADKDPNANGRASRASNLSAASQGAKGPSRSSRDDLFTSAASGVMSMLRTSTELGDIGAIIGDPSAKAVVPSKGLNRRGATSRMSTTSSQSNKSSRASKHQAWPATSSGTRPPSARENNVPEYIPDTLSPTVMNIPGSSPLIPRSREPRDGHRSLSMTNTLQPTFRLSSNRSLASLHNREPIPRPKEAYQYPTRLRRPGYRPTSPVLNEIPKVQREEELHEHGSQGCTLQPGQARQRIPSDSSMRREEMGKANLRRRSRSRSRVPYHDSEIPPVPPLPLHIQQHNASLKQAQLNHIPAKGSNSSSPINQQTASDRSCSDNTSPAAPNGVSVEHLTSPTDNKTFGDNVMTSLKKKKATNVPRYYDYSEQFEREDFTAAEAEPVQTGGVHHIKSIIQERGNARSPSKKIDAEGVNEVAELPGSAMTNLAELPASPVPRRLTRDLVLAALSPTSTTEEVEVSEGKLDGNRWDEISTQNKRDQVTDEAVSEGSSVKPNKDDDNGHSILSQTGSGIMDSSTLKIAAQYSSPVVMGADIGSNTEHQLGSATASTLSPDPTTEYGMTDLLEGYQHTETKDKGCVVHQERAVCRSDEKRSNHIPKSSDEQSFKSCTDLPERPERPEQALINRDAKSYKSRSDLREPLLKDSDTRSFRTCKEPASEVHQPSPLPVNFSKEALVSARELSFPQIRDRTRANSKLSSRYVSAAASVSSSADTFTQQPPSVPPRDSSSSKEAQNTIAIAGFLIHRFHAQSPSAQFDLASEEHEEDLIVRDVNETASDTDSTLKQKDMNKGMESKVQSSGSNDGPAKASTKQEVALGDHIAADMHKRVVLPLTLRSTKVPKIQTAPVAHNRSSSTPSPLVADPSSVYSPDDISFTRSHFQPLPVALSKSPEPNRRVTQTTTYLEWQGRKPSNLPSTSVGEVRVDPSLNQDETTTDLRLSTYRYPGNQLPNLKEESREGSSLDTSASNMRNNSSRFPFSSQPRIRASANDAALFGRSPSTKSQQRSGLAQTQGLPSMNFSHMNLLEKLNDALELCVSQGGEPDDAQESGSPDAKIREKYRSLAISLEELKPDEATYTSTSAKVESAKRVRELMVDVQKLDIPSVGALTERLSEIWPSLKEFYNFGDDVAFPVEDVIMETALEEIHEVGGPAPKRSSARLRPVRGSPNMVVIEDDLFEELTKDTLSPSAGELTLGPGGGEIGFGMGRSKSVGNPNAREKAPLAELEDASPAFLRTRSLSLGHRHELRPSLESELSSRRSHRSLISTPTATTDTRPWNCDKNYPWATSVNSVDISLPVPTSVKHSPRPGPSLLRNHLSNSSTSGPFGDGGSPKSPSSSTPTRDQSHRISVLTSKSHLAGERYPTSALTAPTDLQLINDPQSTFTDLSDDEMPSVNIGRDSGVSKLRKKILRKSQPTASMQATSAFQAPYVGPDEQSPSLPRQLPLKMFEEGSKVMNANGNRRQTFQGAKGMSKRAIYGRSVVNTVKDWYAKAATWFSSLTKGKTFKGEAVKLQDL